MPAGKPLKGLGFIKGKDDPVALREDEYPEWLWTLLDKKEGDGAKDDAGDEFCEFLLSTLAILDTTSD